MGCRDRSDRKGIVIRDESDEVLDARDGIQR